MADHSYERATQLLPAAAVLAPLSVLAILTFRADDAGTLFRSVVSVIAATGFHVVAMRLIRDRGNQVQVRLWKSWGGSPTTLMLRWSSGEEASVRLVHQRVQNFTGVKLPSRRLEQSNPVAADLKYADAVKVLRELTRDHARYPRVWSELKQYGTARNLYGTKPAALVVAGVAAAVSALLVWLSLIGTWNLPWLFPALSFAFSVLAAIAWLAIITPEYVRTASQRYSDALISSIRV